MTELQLMVAGYCHSIQKSLSTFNYFIPIPIIELCIKFHGASSIITIPLGQCGINLHRQLLESIVTQYNTDNNKITNTYFRTSNNSLKARSLIIDLEASTVDLLKSSSISDIYETSNLIFASSGAGHNWAKGHYTEGAELIDVCIDHLTKEIECYDIPEGVQIFHGLGGGTGAGMGTLLMCKIKDHFPDLDILSFSVFPAPKCGSCIVQPYNTILSLNQMDECCDGTFVIDNECLWGLSHNQFKIKQPSYENINFIASQMIDDITALFRYNDTHRFNTTSFLNEMVRYPKLKYFTTSRAPFYTHNGKVETYNEDKLVSKLFESKYRTYSYCDIQEGVNLSTILLNRNRNPQSVTSEDVPVIFDREVISTSISEPPLYGKESVAMIANSTAVKTVLQRMSSQFAKMYKRKAFLHWYKGEGMDEMEFQEADMCVRDTITEYIDKENELKQHFLN